MANVTDLQLWRAAPLANPRHASGPCVLPRLAGDPSTLGEEQPSNQELEAVELSTVLRTLFDSGRDQVVWNLSESIPPGQQYLRLDPRHGFAPAIARSLSAASRVADPSAETQPWLIVVGDARETLRIDKLELLRNAVDQVRRIVIVVCDSEVGEPAESADLTGTTRLAIEASAGLRCEYAGPIDLDDSTHLAQILLGIKRLGRPTVLHLRTHESRPSPERPGESQPRQAETSTSGSSLWHVASRELAALASTDGRIVALSTDRGAAMVGPWAAVAARMLSVESGIPHALEWCASVAAAGSRPFVFLTCEELQNSLGEMRQSICLRRAGVTLVVAPGGEAEMPSSASLAGVRQLPHTALVSPKDPFELRQMLQWCAHESEPAVIWLPQTDDLRAADMPGPPIVAGRSETIVETGDVLLIAWGPMLAAAQLAARRLASDGIRTAIVNARFAQPLDAEGMARAAGRSLCVVIVDDGEASGGFGGWVLEQLLRLGVTQPISITAPSAAAVQAGHRDAVEECAAAIVERCRWLSDPIAPAISIAPAATNVGGEACTALSDNWLASFAREGDRALVEREQVHGRQLSSDAKRWVAAYELVGRRDLYLWKWCMHGVEITTLPCVAAELRPHVCDTKLLSIVLCVLLDDVADQHGDSHLLDALLEMTCWGVCRSLKGLSDVEKRHAKLTRELWAEYQARVACYPDHSTFEPVLRYDLLQFFNTMRYSHMVNGRPYLLNMVEHDLYTSHNMMMISFAMLDLMCSAGFPRAEVGILRETMWHAQCMGRIGNLLSTWRRELADRDFTSGVFARALMEGDLSLADLERGNLDEIETIVRSRGHEAHFVQKWLGHRQLCHERARRIRSLDMRPVLDGHDRFFAMHLGSQGLI
jgi:transketolase C-terminal domain/subunit